MATARYVLAIDEGSTGVRALLYDRDGRTVAKAYLAIEASYPQAGWVEHDPIAVWQATISVARGALADAGAKGTDLAAIGLTGQRSTAVAWSASTSRPLAPAISWQDLRTAQRCAELLQEGHFVVVLGAASKFEWLAKHAPAVRAAVASGDARFGTLESWLVWKLSGGTVHVTDGSFASTTCLFDFLERRWNPALLDVLGVPEPLIPMIRPSSERYGETDASLFGAAIPIAAIAGDQQAAMFGELCLEPGSMKISYGTSAMCNLNAGTSLLLSTHGAFPLVLWGLGGELHYCLEGNAITAGASVEWLYHGLGTLGSLEESDALARSVPDSGGVWAVPAFQGLGTPHLDPAARAAIGGLSRGSGRGHVVRAVLEGVALRCAEIFDALVADWPTGPPNVLRADGGAARNDFLLEFQSDILGIPVERPETIEAAASGAAYLAGLAVGFWPDVDALAKIRRVGARFEPKMSADERAERRARFETQVAAVREVGS
jgi:glycerol kinase